MEPGGQLDMQQLLAAAAAMQNQLLNAQQELADTEVDGTAGGGLVTVTVNGQGDLVDVHISAAAVDADDPEETAQTLSDLILAAYRDAIRAADDLQEETMGPLAAGLGPGGLPGMPDISGFPGLTGLPGMPGMPAGIGDPEDEPSDPEPDDPPASGS